MNQINLKQHSEFTPFLFFHADVLRFLNVLALSLIAVSLLYLVAANWWMLPKTIRLLIPMFALLSSAIGSYYFDGFSVLRQSLDTFSGLMLGLSLAVIGQIYQTGADSYLLFLVWAILLLPWLYRPNIGVFSLLIVVSQLALYFYFKQSFWMERAEWLYLIGLNSLTAFNILYAIYRYPNSILRFAFIAFLIVISIFSMFGFLRTHHLFYLASVFVLPLITAFYFYRQQRVLESILLIAGVALSLSLWLIEQLDDQFTNSAVGLFILAVLIFTWFAAISFVMTRLFPKSALSVIPLAIGAWISGFILSVLLLTFWQALSVAMGVLFIVISWLLLHRSSSLFARQFAYCLWVCGQISVLVHVGLLTNNLWLVWLLQLVLLLFTIVTAKHWFILTLQLIASHVLGVTALFLSNTFTHNEILMSVVLGINYFIFMIVLVLARYWQSSVYMKSIILWLMAILFGMAVFYSVLGWIRPDIHDMAHLQIMLFYILPSVFALFFVLRHFQFLKNLWSWSIPFLGFLLILLGYFEIFLILVFMAWAIVYQYKWLQALCVILLIFWLWMLYYNLGVSFLYKSLTLCISGIMLWLTVYGLIRTKQNSAQGEVV